MPRKKLLGQWDPAKRVGKYFKSMPNDVIYSEKYAKLSNPARAVLFEFLVQYQGDNNGDLIATWSFLQQRGFRSRSTIHRALRELLSEGFIIVSRQGGRNYPTLYAMTFFAVDECWGKLDIESTAYPPGYWPSADRPQPLSKRNRRASRAKAPTHKNFSAPNLGQCTTH